MDLKAACPPFAKPSVGKAIPQLGTRWHRPLSRLGTPTATNVCPRCRFSARLPYQEFATARRAKRWRTARPCHKRAATPADYSRSRRTTHEYSAPHLRTRRTLLRYFPPPKYQERHPPPPTSAPHPPLPPPHGRRGHHLNLALLLRAPPYLPNAHMLLFHPFTHSLLYTLGKKVPSTRHKWIYLTQFIATILFLLLGVIQVYPTPIIVLALIILIDMWQQWRTKENNPTTKSFHS